MSLSEALPTTAIDTVGVYTPKRYRQLQMKELRGVYVASRAGLELAILWSKGIDSSNAPSRPIIIFIIGIQARSRDFNRGGSDSHRRGFM